MSNSRLYKLASRNKYPAGVYIQFLLLWVALADERASEDELRVLKEKLPSETRTIDINKLISLVKANHVDDFSAACAALSGLTTDARELFIELAIDVAVADNRLTISENHILRFFADAFLPDPRRLNFLYKEMTGKPIPDPVDLSYIDKWTRNQYRSDNADRKNNKSNGGDGARKQKTIKMTRVSAMATLGLEGNPSNDEIKKAYRRLAQVHHPDRFNSLGQDATSVANHTFKRIQVAYDYLKSDF